MVSSKVVGNARSISIGNFPGRAERPLILPTTLTTSSFSFWPHKAVRRLWIIKHLRVNVTKYPEYASPRCRQHMRPEDAGRVRLSSAEPSIRLQGSATDRTPTEPCVLSNEPLVRGPSSRPLGEPNLDPMYLHEQDSRS
jgi:hypothetical protein